MSSLEASNSQEIEPASQSTETEQIFYESLQNLYIDYARKEIIYWKHYRGFRCRNNWLSIPLIIMTSITGATSVSQLSPSASRAMAYVVVVFGMSSAVLTGLQKYLKYAERMEHCKYVSKSYAFLIERIRNIILLFNAGMINKQDLTNYINDIHQERLRIIHYVDIVPLKLIGHNRFVRFFIGKFSKCLYNETFEDDINEKDYITSKLPYFITKKFGKQTSTNTLSDIRISV